MDERSPAVARPARIMAPEVATARLELGERTVSVTLIWEPDRPFDEFRARRHFAALDGIRALSILAVLWHHTAAGLGGIPLSSRGFLGVGMFFVLSGFLIVTLLLRERDRTGGISLKRFYARRTLRIFPIYYLVIALLLAWVLLNPASGMREAFLRELPYHLTYTTNWIRSTTVLAIAWSLATEEQFYLLWPPLEKFFARRVLHVLAAVIVLNELVNFGVLDGFLQTVGLPRGEYSILQSTFTPICLGVLLAHVLNHPAGFERVRGVLARKWAPWLVLAGLVAVANTPGDISGLPRLSIYVLMTLFLAGCVLDEGHAVSRALSRPALRWIGGISYGMYLYHHFARHGAELLLGKLGVDSPLAVFALCTLLTIAIAALSFRWIEAPLMRWKKRLTTV